MKIALLLLLIAFGTSYAICEDTPAWREDFSNAEQNDAKRWTPKDWEYKGKPFTEDAVFDLVSDSALQKRVLHMYANKGSGTFMREVKNIDLKKYPIMRWCWRVKALPLNADGRVEAKDDQAVGIYLGTGRFRQSSVAYRWETLTPHRDSGTATYGGGFVSVKWFAMRNQTDSYNTWIVDSANVAQDYQAAYGYLPEKFAISVVCNSQNTKSTAEAEVAWIEFIAAPATDSTPVKKEGQ